MTDIFKELDCSPNGLTQSEAERRLKKYGFNTMPEAKKKSFAAVFLWQFCDPLIYILLFSAAVSIFLGEFSDGIFIAAILTLNSLIGATQEYSSQKSSDSLKRLIKSKCLVLRDGKEMEIDSKFLTTGDVVILKEGSKIPADLVLFESEELQVDESMLTGESEAVRKDHRYKQRENCPTQEKLNEVFGGSIVMKGFGKGATKAVGAATEMGKIADKVSEKSGARTPLVERIESFSRMFTGIMIVSAIIIIMFEVKRGSNIEETLLTTVGLAVAAIPEGLPITITIALSIGVAKMVKKNVIVRNLSAVEALGSCTVIASDKTGTLTQNELKIMEVFDRDGAFLSVEKTGTTKKLDKKNFDNFTNEELIILSSALPNEAFCNEKGEYFGDAVDAAFLKYVECRGYRREDIKNNFKIIKQIYYTSELRLSAAFCEINGEIYAFAKGACETIFDMCGDHGDAINKQLEEFSNNGRKVLAAAFGKVEKNGALGQNSLKNLNFLALASMLDPLRDESAEAVRKCQDAGIRIIMVTGDNPRTAFAISKQLGLADSMDDVKTGQDVRAAKENGDASMAELTAKTKVYSRMEPIQKLDIVNSLIKNDNYVAVTGDGVNDAPALHNANVGVAMGKNGTDIARETADIILTDDNFRSIAEAVEEGRIVYNNIRKVIFFCVSCGIPKVIIYILSLIFGLPMPFNASQLLWLNVMTEGVQNIFLAFEAGEGGEMRQKPRDPTEPIFNKVMVRRAIVSIFFITALCFGVYYWALKKMHFGGVVASSMTLMLFVFIQNMQVLNSRSEVKSIFSHSLRGNSKIIIGIVSAVLIHLFAANNPLFSGILRVSKLNFRATALLFLLAITVVLVSEVEKFLRRQKM
ncbi:MAG: HAD-IC family P-type ATPase [Rickettsiales bacterium]|jgi:Ca2+-transporting ATPase|nr:HAD-IC family P-type ATPase [Rickettsiales bacterium]